MDKIWEEMYNAAKAVLKPVTISDYVSAGEVSAAVRSKTGKIYTGVCIDTCSTLGICAERNAIGSAIADGETKIKAIAIYSPNMYNCTPCGACRQVINEFKTDNTVVITVSADEIITNTIEELLPGGFTL